MFCYMNMISSDFYKVYQKNPKDAVSLLGLGVGFGNFGEYQEAKKYFDTNFRDCRMLESATQIRQARVAAYGTED